MITGVIPFLSLFLFNLLTYLELKKIQVNEAIGRTTAAQNIRKKEIKLAQISLYIVAGKLQIAEVLNWIVLDFKLLIRWLQ